MAKKSTVTLKIVFEAPGDQSKINPSDLIERFFKTKRGLKIQSSKVIDCDVEDLGVVNPQYDVRILNKTKKLVNEILGEEYNVDSCVPNFHTWWKDQRGARIIVEEAEITLILFPRHTTKKYKISDPNYHKFIAKAIKAHLDKEDLDNER